MITSSPRASAPAGVFAHPVGRAVGRDDPALVRHAEAAKHFVGVRIVSQSDLLPMMMPTSGRGWLVMDLPYYLAAACRKPFAACALSAPRPQSADVALSASAPERCRAPVTVTRSLVIYFTIETGRFQWPHFPFCANPREMIYFYAVGSSSECTTLVQERIGSRSSSFVLPAAGPSGPFPRDPERLNRVVACACTGVCFRG